MLRFTMVIPGDEQRKGQSEQVVKYTLKLLAWRISS